MQGIVMNLFISMSNETEKWQNIGLTLPGFKRSAGSIALNVLVLKNGQTGDQLEKAREFTGKIKQLRNPKILWVLF